MSSALLRRRTNCEDCGSRCRGLPVRVTLEGFNSGGEGRVQVLRWLCAVCKRGMWTWLFNPDADLRPTVHPAGLRFAKWSRSDVEDATTAGQWR
jgi:hypothetical protein